MARPIARRWVSPGNLPMALRGPFDRVEDALWELHELGVKCAYGDVGASLAARSVWGDEQYGYRFATFSVDESDRQRVYQFGSRRQVWISEVKPVLHNRLSQGLPSFRLAQVCMRETPDIRFLRSATYRRRFYRPPRIIDSVKVVFDVRPDLEYPRYLDRCQKLPRCTASLSPTNWYRVVDTQRGDIAELLTNIGLEVHLYTLGAEKPWRSGGTLAIYFRGSGQLAALLRRTRFADTRIAHGLPTEPELKESLRQIQYCADLCEGRIKPKKRPKRAKRPQAHSQNC